MSDMYGLDARNLSVDCALRRTVWLTPVTLIVLCVFSPALTSKKAVGNVPSPANRLAKAEDCPKPSDALHDPPSSSAEESRSSAIDGSAADTEAKTTDSKSQTPVSNDPMKVRFVLNEDKELPGVSAECAKGQSDPGSPQCQAEKEKSDAAAPQCERPSAPSHDLTLPASSKTDPQE